jgi:hypothetical protein
VSLVPGGVTKSFRASVQTPPADPAPDFTVEFDVAAANEIAVIDAPDVCQTTATTITCPDSGSEYYDTPFEASARPGAAVGATASVPVRVVSGGRTVASSAGRVTIAEGVDLAALDLQGDTSIATGATAGIAAGVRNAGDRPVTGIVLQLFAQKGFAAGEYGNCTALEYGAACLFDDTLAPGAELRLAAPLALTATNAVWAPSQWSASISWLPAQDYADSGGTLPIRGTGPELELAAAPAARAASPPQTDTVSNNNFDDWNIAVTGWDFRLRIDRASTRRGEIKTQVIGPAGAPPGDPNPADDRAPIVVTATAAGSGSGGSGGGGTLPISGPGTAAAVGVVMVLLGAATRFAFRRG